MRKISLILALILVLTCGVFAACSEDPAESSAPATSDVSKNESKPADDSSAPADDSSAPADDSSAPADDSSAPADELTGEVISAGASYTMQDLFRQNSNWEWDETCDPAYPDTDNKELTDGEFAPAEAHQLYDGAGAPWCGFHSMHPDYEKLGYSWITVDLGEATEISGAKIYSASSTVSAATIASVTVYVSEDNENWTELGSATVEDNAALTVIGTSIAGSANAQYVQFRFTASGYWMGVCEVEVYGPAAE